MIYLNDVVTLKLDSSKCVKCGECVQVCPRAVFDLSSELKIINKDACIECGACQMNCPTKAISVDAGTGCAMAIMTRYFKNSKWLKPLANKDCC